MAYESLKEQYKNEGYPKIQSLTKAGRLKYLKEGFERKTSFLDDFYNKKIPFKLRIFCVVEDIIEIPKCKLCQSNVSFRDYNSYTSSFSGFTHVIGFSTYCSYQCSRSAPEAIEKRKQTNLKRYGETTILNTQEHREQTKQKLKERYGSEHPMHCKSIREKQRQTNLKRYGAEHFLNTEQGKQKSKETSIQRYGVEHPMYSDEVKEKIFETNKERYGFKSPMQNPEMKEKHTQIIIDIYGVENPSQMEGYREKVIKTNNERYGRNHYKQKHIPVDSINIMSNKEKLEELYTQDKCIAITASKLNVTASYLSNLMDQYGIVKYTPIQSVAEVEIYEFITSVTKREVQSSVRNIIPPKELDIYIPSLNLAVEYNGLYWHSEEWKDKNYHKDKQRECEEKGITLIQIFEDEWHWQRDIVKSKLKRCLGVFEEEKVNARNTIPMNVSSSQARDFHDIYHIQGHYSSSSINIGLFHREEMVCCMSIKRENNNSNTFHISRFSSSKQVNGGFSKLLSYFRKNYEWEEIITFADKRWGNGGVYLQNGFEFVYTTEPNYFYVCFKDSWTFPGLVRFSRQRFMKHKIKNVLPFFDENLTEHENMLTNGFIRVYDAGNNKFRLINN